MELQAGARSPAEVDEDVRYLDIQVPDLGIQVPDAGFDELAEEGLIPAAAGGTQ